jgi:hypothetical protein
MNNDMTRPNRRPKLFLPAFLAPALAGAAGNRAKSPFPLSAPELRRVMAEMLD